MKTKTKLIVWSIIWLITYCFLKTPCLTDENKALLNIINSYTFAYITIELIIEPIYKKNNKILYISVCILDLITFIFLKELFGISLSIFILTSLIFPIEKGLSSFKIKFKQKQEIILKTFLLFSSFLLYSLFFYFLDKQYLKVDYILAPFIFEYIKTIINSI
ncbi:MAG: hypothetical protein Q4A77_07275 [Leptotrichia hongkongensis]|nr:hypothetical protein [Leptotrichia hongkongensis]